jgi:hypothetical protein
MCGPTKPDPIAVNVRALLVFRRARGLPQSRSCGQFSYPLIIR